MSFQQPPGGGGFGPPPGGYGGPPQGGGFGGPPQGGGFGGPPQGGGFGGPPQGGGFGGPPQGGGFGGPPQGGGFGPPPAGYQPPPGYGSPAPGMPPAGGPGMQGGQTEGMAVGSLVTGLLSIPGHFCCYLGWPLGAVSIILGILSIVKINKEPGRWSGKGMAIGGIISSALGFLLILVVILIYGAAIIFASP